MFVPLQPGHCKNFLLSIISEQTYSQLLPSLELVSTPLHFKLAERNKPIQYAYFPLSGEHSILTTMESGSAVEIGTIGFEGFSAIDLVLDADTASETTVCQIAGESLRMPADQFRSCLHANDDLRRTTHRYMRAYLTMVSQATACNALHSVESRFARWMLMSYDRVHSAEFHLTQEYIAMMLGTHRPTISLVAGTFQRAGILQYRRGNVTVLDREALEDACCECYGIVRDAFKRFLGVYPMEPGSK